MCADFCVETRTHPALRARHPHPGFMARPLRPEGPGRVFHITARATWRRELFVDGTDREDFLRLLERIVKRYRWQVLGWCLLGTHYHLLVRTPKPTLGLGMRDLNGIYARDFNKRHGRHGSVLSERYADRVIRSYGAPDEGAAVHRAEPRPRRARQATRAVAVEQPRSTRRPRPPAPSLAARRALRAFFGRTAEYRRYVDSCAGLSTPVAPGTSHSTASGGSVTSADHACSFQGTASASTPSPLPTSEPP